MTGKAPTTNSTTAGASNGPDLSLTPELLHILQHALGVDNHGQGAMYRNQFCAGGSDEPLCRELVAMGYMREHRRTAVLPYYNCSVTDAGKQAVRDQSPPPPKLTRSQQRYRRFANADSGLSFREWLRYEQSREAGGAA